MVAEEATIEALPPADRSMDDILAGVIRFTLGGQPFAMAVLPMGAHDRWERALDTAIQPSFDDVPDEGPGVLRAMAAAFRATRTQMLEALIAYDRDKVLPSRDDILEIATQQDILAAIREVRAVGGDPLAASALNVLHAQVTWTNPPLTPVPEPSSGSPKSTAGRRRTSRKP